MRRAVSSLRVVHRPRSAVSTDPLGSVAAISVSVRLRGSRSRTPANQRRDRPQPSQGSHRPPSSPHTTGSLDLDRPAELLSPPRGAAQQQLSRAEHQPEQVTRAPASAGYVKNTLRAIGIQPRILRSTRITDLVTTVDVKLVGAAYGMANEAVTAYLADHVDAARLSNL